MNGVIEVDDPTYPSLLKKIKNPPERLYYKGLLDQNIFKNCLGVVGSRSMSTYGERVVRHIFSHFHNVEITIVSGFMYGIDACAHRTAIEYDIPTIAVLPCGIDLVHPSDQENLYSMILSSRGLILSEYAETIPPRVWTYPKRNRIVAGICRGVLVIECDKKSGSIITASLARDFNRKVFTVPGDIFRFTSRGVLELLQDYAIPVGSGQDVIKQLDLVTTSESPTKAESGTDTNEIIALLKETPRTPFEILSLVNIESNELNIMLSMWLLEGKIVELGGRFRAV